MLDSPKSLTATIYVRFHYDEPAPKVEEGEERLINKILDQASDMSPRQRELFVKFADYLSHIDNNKNKQSPT